MFNADAGPYPWLRRRGAGSSHLIQDPTSSATDARRDLQESADVLNRSSAMRPCLLGTSQ